MTAKAEPDHDGGASCVMRVEQFLKDRAGRFPAEPALLPATTAIT